MVHREMEQEQETFKPNKLVKRLRKKLKTDSSEAGPSSWLKLDIDIRY